MVTRDLVYRFMELPTTRQLRIMQTLELITDVNPLQIRKEMIPMVGQAIDLAKERAQLAPL